MTTLGSAATQDIDALLAEADSLMDAMAANLGSSETARAGEIEEATDETTDDTTPHATDDDFGSDAGASASGNQADEMVRGLVSELAGFADQADTNAIAGLLEVESADGASAKKVDRPIGQCSQNANAPGPQPAPQDWLTEADLAEGSKSGAEQLPQIPETLAGPGEASTEQAGRRKSGSRLLRFVGIGLMPVVVVLQIPVALLIFMDAPFANLSARAKACIGYAAIGTLLVAGGTWVLGNFQTLN